MAKKAKQRKIKARSRKASKYADSGKNLTLSLCMIVRNEEKRLPQCLESIRPYVDEIVVVDTGSSDRTMEIARGYGARIFQHPWEDNFSLHRNQSISYATGDWIILMDADEALAPGTGHLLRQAIQTARPETTHLHCQLVDVNRDGTARSIYSQVRNFRNGMGFRFQGIVHNRLCTQGKSEQTSACIIHYGYDLSPEEMSAKYKRTVALLEIQLKEAPDDIFALFNMAQSHCMEGESNEAIRFGERVRKLLKQAGFQPRFYINVYYLLAISFLSIGRLEKTVEVCEEGIALEPAYLDLVFLLAYVHYRLKQDEKAKNWCCRYLEMLDDSMAVLPHPYLVFYRAKNKPAVQMLLSLILLREGEMDEAQRLSQDVYRQWCQWQKASFGAVDFPAEASGLLVEYQLEKGDEREALDIARKVLNRPFANRECLWHLFRPFFERRLFLHASEILKVLASLSPIDLPNIRNLIPELLPSWPFAARIFYRVLKQYDKSEALRDLEAVVVEKMGKAYLSLCNSPSVISASLIVKDEEKLLPMCLESIRPHVDEIMVVDTGSRDRTVEIARSYGARVFFHPWEDDFSKHRNQSIQYACGDWILIIDADEELDGGTGQGFRQEIEKNDSDTLYFMVRSTLAGGSQWSYQASPRVFRNGIGIHYEGIVHNQLRLKGRVKHANIVLHHRGYNLGPENMARKLDRTRRLLERQIQDNPQDALALHNLSVLQFMKGDYSSVIQTAEEALSLVHGNGLRDVAYMGTYYLLAAGHYMRGDMEDAEKWAERGMEYDERNLDAACVMCAVKGAKGNPHAIIEWAGKYLSLYERLSKKPEDFQGSIFHTLGQVGEVALSLGFALWHKGKREDAREAFDLAERMAPDGSSVRRRADSFMENNGEAQRVLHGRIPGTAADPKFHFKKGMSLLRNGDFDGAEKCLRLALDAQGPDPTICMAMAAIRLGSGDVDACVNYLNEIFRMISYPVTGQILDIPQLIALLKRLGQMLEKKRFPEAASIAIQMADDLGLSRLVCSNSQARA